MTKFKSILAASLFAAVAATSASCTTEIDHDALRSGAIPLELGIVTNDELYPTAGDEIDWKMIFVPTAGDITVRTFWDQGLELFDVEIGIYDRFGIPIKTGGRDADGKTGVLKAFSPETGLHFIKISATSGRSIYSVTVEHETNYEGYQAPDTFGSFDEYLDFDGEMQNSDADQKNKSASSGAAAAPAATAPLPGGGAAPASGGALPVVGAGGVALPTAAAGGIAAPGGTGDAGATIVKTASGAPAVPKNEIKTLDNKTGSASKTDTFKPICPDVKAKDTITADVLSVSSASKGSKVKLAAGSKQGVESGSVVDIYVDGKILEGGRCRVDTINAANCTCTTNAPAKIVKTASKFVIKVPK